MKIKKFYIPIESIGSKYCASTQNYIPFSFFNYRNTLNFGKQTFTEKASSLAFNQSPFSPKDVQITVSPSSKGQKFQFKIFRGRAAARVRAQKRGQLPFSEHLPELP